MHRDISDFKIGEVATSFVSKDRYKVLHYNFTVKKNKRQVESSTCLDLDTGREVIITWHKNKNFT